MISPRLAIAATVLTVAIAVPSVVVAAEASSASTVHTTSVNKVAPKSTTYKNCTEIHKHWSGGIAKKGVTTNTTHSKGKTYHRALKGTVKHDTALYNANKKSDADKDGIACEKS